MAAGIFAIVGVLVGGLISFVGDSAADRRAIRREARAAATSLSIMAGEVCATARAVEQGSGRHASNHQIDNANEMQESLVDNREKITNTYETLLYVGTRDQTRAGEQVLTLMRSVVRAAMATAREEALPAGTLDDEIRALQHARHQLIYATRSRRRRRGTAPDSLANRS